MYRMIDHQAGLSSMVDIFMISILVALVGLFGTLATIEPGVGAICFAAVVIITMFASMSFDPRLIWDARRSRPCSRNTPPRLSGDELPEVEVTKKHHHISLVWLR